MTDARRGMVMVAVAAMLWGTWSIFLRWAALPGLQSGAIFMTLLALVGLPAQWRHRKRARPRSAWLYMLFFGVMDAGNTGFFFLAVTRGPVAVATLSHYLAPVITPLIVFLMLKERPSRRTYPAVVLGLVGLWLLLRPRAGALPESAAFIAGTAALGAASAAFYATMVPFGKKLSAQFTSFEVLGFHSWPAAAVLWMLAPRVSISFAQIGKLCVGGLICGVVGGALFYRGVRSIPSGLASVLTYLEPLVATGIGTLLFAEPLGPTAALGAALVLGGGLYLAAETFGAAGAAVDPT